MNLIVSDRAKKLMQQKGLVGADIAKQVPHLELVTVGSILKGRTTTGHSTIKLIAQYLGTTSDYLTGKSDDPRPQENVA